MGNRRCNKGKCCLEEIFPGENRKAVDCASGCFLGEKEQEFVDFYEERYPEQIEKFTTLISQIQGEIEFKISKSTKENNSWPFKRADKKAKITERFQAYSVKWKCNKGHTNFQTVLSLGIQHDVCLQCGNHYEYMIDSGNETGN